MAQFNAPSIPEGVFFELVELSEIWGLDLPGHHVEVLSPPSSIEELVLFRAGPALRATLYKTTTNAFVLTGYDGDGPEAPIAYLAQFEDLKSTVLGLQKFLGAPARPSSGILSNLFPIPWKSRRMGAK